MRRYKHVGAREKTEGMVAVQRICFRVDARHEPRSDSVGVPANSGIGYENVNNVKSVKVTINGTQSHVLVLLHHNLRGAGTLTSSLHHSEKGIKGIHGGQQQPARFWYSTQPSHRLLSYEPMNHKNQIIA